MIKLLLADDHQLFIDGLMAVLKNENNMKVIAQALNGEQVLAALAATPIDIVILDINMPYTRITDLVKEIRSRFGKVQIIILTMHHGSRYYTKLRELGISGYLLKSAEKKEVIEAINKVYEGENYISKEISSNLTAARKEIYPSFDNQLARPEELLTRREIEILKLIIQEYTNNEIAEKLFISTGTVDTHRKNIILKLGVKNTVGLIKYAIKSGLSE